MPFFDESPLDLANMLQNGLVGRAEGGSFDNLEYIDLRHHFMNHADFSTKLPAFVRQCRNISQFWSFIKGKFKTYHERRTFIWEEFRPLLDYLEAQERTPGIAPITAKLEAFDPDRVHAVWQKALDRRTADPEGAITAARSLIETVCKHILDDQGVAYSDDADPAKLWALAAEGLNLAPHQQQEQVFKAILGNCQSVVNHLAAIRNRVGDAHGQGRRQVRPKARHAELAVNIAGAMSSFLIATWNEKRDRHTGIPPG